MQTFASLTKVSGNSKTGPIPVSTTGKNSCPDTCGFKAKGCYASYGPANIHWSKVTSGERGKPWLEFCKDVKSLAGGQLWRHNQAGDLVPLSNNNALIDSDALNHLVRANKGKRGFAYTHHNPFIEENAALIKEANKNGFTINLSAENLNQANKLKALNIAPVVVVLQRDAGNVTYTRAGHKVVACPAEKSDKVNCSNCGLCQDSSRNYIIGFRAHGTAAKTVELITKG